MDRSKSKANENKNVDSMARIMFTNLLLLGMDVEDMECVYKIPFKKDMFNEYNKTGSEAVLYFLFYNLNPTLCDEQFRDCWPIIDKKSEIHFRKTCNNWLVSIKKNEPDVHWPILNASSLQFPGRFKFIHILYKFTTHVLRQNIKPELEQHHTLTCPSLSSHSNDMDIMSSSVNDNASLELKQFLNQMHITSSAHQMWKTYADELVKDCRGVAKSQRDVEQEKRPAVSLLAEAAVKQCCTLPMKRTLNMFDGDKDVTTVKRGQRLQRALEWFCYAFEVDMDGKERMRNKISAAHLKASQLVQAQDTGDHGVKASWEKVTSFSEELERRRGIVKSVLENSTSKDVLDATDIGFRIPGLLLKQCEKEIRQQQIDNVFIGGRLNLLSVFQLWNLCLRLYSEQIESENLPDVSKEVPGLTMQAHKFHSFLMQIQTLRKEMSSIFIPELEQSIQHHRENVKAQIEAASLSQNQSSLGLQLSTQTLPSSVLNKSQYSGDTPAGPFVTSMTKRRKDTPTVVSEMISSITNATHKAQTMQPSQLVHAFEYIKSTQRSSSKTNTPKNVQSSSTVKNAKRLPVSKLQGKEATVSKATRLQSEHKGRNHVRPGNEIKPALIGRKVANSKSNIDNKSYTNENESASLYQKALDEMAQSVAHSVLSGKDQSYPKATSYPFSEGMAGDVNQNNATSFSQALMSELEQNVSYDLGNTSTLDVDRSPPNNQRFSLNGARPKERPGDLLNKLGDSPRGNRFKYKTSASTGHRERVSPRTRTAETSTHAADFSSNSGANGSNMSFLDRFDIEMSQSLSPFNDKSQKEMRIDRTQIPHSENFSHDDYSLTWVSGDDSLYANSSPDYRYDFHSQPGLISLQDSHISHSSKYNKSERFKQEDLSYSMPAGGNDVLDNSQTDSIGADNFDGRGPGDGQASEDFQAAGQSVVSGNGNDSDEHEDPNNDCSDNDMLNSSHYSLIDSQNLVKNEVLTTKSYLTPSEMDDFVFPRRSDSIDADTLSIASLKFEVDNTLRSDTDTSSLVGNFQAFDNDADDDDKAIIGLNDSFSPLKHGILLDSKSPIKAAHISTLMGSTYYSPNDHQKAHNNFSASGFSEPKSRFTSSAMSSTIQTEVANLFAQGSEIFDDID